MTIAEQLSHIEQLLIISSKAVLNTREVAIMLGVTEDRVRHLVSARDIPHYRQKNRVYFKKSEIENWQLARRVPTNDEIQSRAATYVVLNKKK
jgi:excisionase family DNA binding protein